MRRYLFILAIPLLSLGCATNYQYSTTTSTPVLSDESYAFYLAAAAIDAQGNVPILLLPGSSKDDVARVLGMPSQIGKYNWTYNDYAIYFNNSEQVSSIWKSGRLLFATEYPSWSPGDRRHNNDLIYTYDGQLRPAIVYGTAAENGSYYGQISENTGRAKTVHVDGYFRKDGTYVRSHYRSPPR